MKSFARTLVAAVDKYQYDLKDFIEKAVTTNIFADYLDDYTMYIQEGTYIAARISEELKRRGETICKASELQSQTPLATNETAYWIGYLMLYWRYMEQVTPTSFLKYNFEEIIWAFDVLHTQSVEYAIEIIKEEYQVSS